MYMQDMSLSANSDRGASFSFALRRTTTGHGGAVSAQYVCRRKDLCQILPPYRAHRRGARFSGVRDVGKSGLSLAV